MEAQLEKIRDQQRETWNRFSPGWKKWDEFTMHFLKPFGDEIIKMIEPGEGDVVLDIASGTGEPGLTIATMVGNGKVVITDLAEGMLDVARENAAHRGIRNVDFVPCDVSELPFDDNTFDAISCRMGFMFFPDMEMAAKEMYRVLKPGGRIATAVWGVPEKNFWITSIMSAISQNIQVPTPEPGAPGMFRVAKEGLLSGILTQSGFRWVREVELSQKMEIGDEERFWNFHNEVAAPVVAAMAKADGGTKAKIKKEVFEALRSRYPDGHVYMEYSGRVISALK
jgi:ubiquinone/menaquinone biosynthesis C-methylase UbiE